jgi:magnesium chelatase subunit D
MARNLDLARLLECVAISDALSGLLLVGASASMVDTIADRLMVLLQAAGATKVDRVRLGSGETEDSLWGVPGAPAQWGGGALLIPPEGTTRLVIAPELSRLSRPAARAAVALLESREITLQRRGHATPMAVRQRWIAGIAESDLGSVSPHLLERFAIRIRMQEQVGSDRVATLKARLSGTTATLVDPDSVERVRNAICTSQLDPEVIPLAMTLCDTSGLGGSMRPGISLLRVAETWARLERADELKKEVLIESARALGLDVQLALTSELRADRAATHVISNAAQEGSPKEPDLAVRELLLGETKNEVAPLHGDNFDDEDLEYQPGDVISPEAPEISVAPVTQDPVTPEKLPARTEFTTLRLPWRQARAAESGKGTIIGTRRTESVKDLAIFDTLFAALPYQSHRRSAYQIESDGLVVFRSDLRSYRRLPIAIEQLILVLDYTSVQKRRWQKTLLPFLSDAYAARAELCIIKVGARNTRNEACADRVVVRSVLMPSVADAFRESAGRATPLADGLTQALRFIKQTMGHGRGSTRSTTLVVVTDGRGNVPLEASRQGRLAAKVGMTGIEDVKRVAREISVLPNVKRYLVNPEPDWMKELPFVLASFLGATVVKLDSADV